MGKAGLKSTELWFSVAAFIAGAIMSATGTSGGIAEIIGGVMMMMSPAAYTAGRSSIKGKEAIGAAQVQAARELVKKSEPKEPEG
tara:strand:+ start:302 stop:556 length:255 start_codon:yes stop_codon:yes gene_type:complete